MNAANPTSRRDALQMMQRGLDGETVNGARLARLGACKYSAPGGRTCIVGLLMTPAQRAYLVDAGLNEHDIQEIWDALGTKNIELLQLRPHELKRLQHEFDNGSRQQLKQIITELLEATT